MFCLSSLWIYSPDGIATAAAAPALQFADSQGVFQSDKAFWQQLQSAQVIYLGETHDRLEDHRAQLTIIQRLHQHNPNLVIGMEMFQRPYQHLLDRYWRGQSSDSQLRERSEYTTRWGFDWEFYAPILHYAKAQQIPLMALNVPTEVTRKVSQKGLSSLNWHDRRFIPPLSAIHREPEAYRQMLQGIFQTGHHGHGSRDRFPQFFEAQLLWDETMAEQIAQILQRQTPPPQVIVLAGQGHLVYRYGIPSRVSRRFPQELTQTVVLLSPDSDMAKIDSMGQPIGDLLHQSTKSQFP